MLRSLSLLVFAFLYCTVATAQTPMEAIDSIARAYDLGDITVTATAATPDIPVTFTNLTQTDIAPRNLGQDAPYLLKWTPSVVVNSDAGTGIGYTGIWIRGSDPTRTNITINGIPYNDSESQGVFWVNLPDFSSSANRIQIQRGVGTSVNGAGAFGASIDFNTMSSEPVAQLSLDGGVGSFGTRRGRVQYSSGLLENGLQVDARYSRTHSDGYIDRARADLSGYYVGISLRPGARKRREYADRTGSTYSPLDGAKVTAIAFGGQEQTYQSWNGVTGEELAEFGRTYNSVGTEKPGEPYDNEIDNYGQRHYQLHYDNLLNSYWRLNLSGHYTHGLGYFEQYKAGENPEDYGITGTTAEETDLIRRRWLDNHFYGMVYSLRYRGTDRLALTFGGAANRYLGDHFGEVIWARDAGDSEIRDRYYDNDATKTEVSSYARGTYRLPLPARYGGNTLNAYLDLQLRHVDYEFLGFNNELQQVDQTDALTFFNPKAGLLYDFTGGQAYASFGVAQREPNRNDYTENPAGARPRPEKLLNTEIGLRRTVGRANYGINFYHMAYRDQLVLTGELNDVGEYRRANVDRSYRLGLELQGGTEVAPRLTVGGNLTVSRNRVADYTEFLDDFDEDFGYLGQVAARREDTPLAFSPDLTAAAEVTYGLLPRTSLHQFDVSLQGKYVGDRYVDNSGQADSRLDAYYYADLRLSYGFVRKERTHFPADIRLTLLVRNLTDHLYASNGWGYRYRLAGQETLLRGVYPQAGRNFLLGLGVDF